MDNRIITVEGVSATVKEAAKALGTEEARIAKTLSFKLKNKYIVVVTKGDVKIDNAKYRHTFGEKSPYGKIRRSRRKNRTPRGRSMPICIK